MKKMKKRFTYLLLFLTLLFSPVFVNAASGSYSISSNSTVEIGDTISVTFTIRASQLFYWEAYISHDNSRLQLVSGSTTFQGESSSISGQSTVTKTLKFKAKKTGNASVSISMGSSGNNINANSEEVKFSTVTKKITVAEKKVVTYSSNNSLSSLSVEGFEISPAFKKDTLEYNVELPAQTEKIKINATREDSKASISGDGEQQVREGQNKLVVKVTAENGSTKEYTILANVKELDPIELTLNDETYTVIRKKEQMPKTSDGIYQETTVTIQDEEVPALKSELNSYLLIGLKNSEGITSLYHYNTESNTYTLYRELTFNSLIINPVDEEIKINNGDDYQKITLSINEQSFSVYQSTNNKDFALFVGVNVETGEKSIYSYDQKENSIQRYYDDTSSEKENQDANVIYLYLIIFLGASLVITYLVILIQLVKKKKKPTKISLNYKN